MEKGEYSPFTHFIDAHEIQDTSKAQELLQKGKVGAVVLAGGQATRLERDDPKGTLSVSLIKHKSLFQLISEKTLSMSRLIKRDLPLAFMTSQENYDATLRFFEEHHFFALKKEYLSFFTQGSLPLLDEQGKPILDKDGHIIEGPDGNGSFFFNFVKSGLFSSWQKLHVEYVTVMVIDNPLIHPFDLKLLQVAAQKKNEVTLQAIFRSDVDEKVGVIVEKDNKLIVVEYSEMKKEEAKATLSDASFKHKLANISFFCFSMPFIEKMASLFSHMPLHKAKKRFSEARYRKLHEGASHTFYKCEYFIFDALEYAQKIDVLVDDRENCFAPIKNKTGKDSLETAQLALLNKDRKLFEQISGIRPPADRPFELSPDFYFPTEELKKKWQGKPLPQEKYIP